jgi:hypothetical protein
VYSGLVPCKNLIYSKLMRQKYWLPGGIVWISERILREVRGRLFPSIPAVDSRRLTIARHVTYISKLILHPSKVLEVQIKKENINPKAGQYLFISCPEISYLQYHPFTLTSAPEEDYVSVHMRIVGDWTSVRLSFLPSCFALPLLFFLFLLFLSFLLFFSWFLHSSHNREGI